LACNDCSATCAECQEYFLNDDLSRCGLCVDCITAEVCSSCCQSLGCSFFIEPEEEDEDEEEPVTVLTRPDQNLTAESSHPMPITDKEWNDLQESYGFPTVA